MSEEQTLSESDALQMAVSQITNGQGEDEVSDEPPSKRQKISQDDNLTEAATIKQILFNVNKAICLRLDSIETKLETINLRCKYLEEKLDNMADSSYQKVDHGGSGDLCTPPPQGRRGSNAGNFATRKQSTIIIGLPHKMESQDTQSESQEGTASSPMSSSGVAESPAPNLGPNVTLITLNTEDDYPNGTWLGDENSIEMRVRCPISPSDMIHIHSTSRTAEKMALTLLDYLFDRETQACSNVSGMSKHRKRQLDPLMVYGIRCHLIHKFNISETDWHRIKQNIDSKCRTAFRRKHRGQALTVKAFARKSPSSNTTIYTHQMAENGEQEMHDQVVSQAAVEQIQQMQQQIHIQQVEEGETIVQQGMPEQVTVQHVQEQHTIIPEQVTVQVTQGGETIHLQEGDTIQITPGEGVSIPQGEIQIAVNPEVQVHEIDGEIQIQHPVQLQQS
uniref:Protein BANP n=1 Tax=Saccoglossus kowalevskii TaxID=10224 RepID=A0ABM0M103_SACKO|nr:PREDICTED: protein BANP-like isoform X2 [Saccoglossus kowalevskii]